MFWKLVPHCLFIWVSQVQTKVWRCTLYTEGWMSWTTKIVSEEHFEEMALLLTSTALVLHGLSKTNPEIIFCRHFWHSRNSSGFFSWQWQFLYSYFNKAFFHPWQLDCMPHLPRQLWGIPSWKISVFHSVSFKKAGKSLFPLDWITI